MAFLPPLSFCLPFSGLKVPRLVNMGLSSSPPSPSLVGLLSRLSNRGAFIVWATPEPAGGDLAWKRKRLEVAEEEEEDGWKCEEEE